MIHDFKTLIGNIRRVDDDCYRLILLFPDGDGFCLYDFIGIDKIQKKLETICTDYVINSLSQDLDITYVIYVHLREK